MSYDRPREQSLEEPLNKLLESLSREEIRGLREAIDEREESGDWNKDHIEDLNDLLIDVRRLKSKIRKLSNDNW